MASWLDLFVKGNNVTVKGLQLHTSKAYYFTCGFVKLEILKFFFLEYRKVLLSDGIIISFLW